MEYFDMHSGTRVRGPVISVALFLTVRCAPSTVCMPRSSVEGHGAGDAGLLTTKRAMLDVVVEC